MKTIFKVGQKVYWQDLEGEVIDIREFATYSVEVEFIDGSSQTFTHDGRMYENTPIVLSLTPYTLNGFSQEPQIEKDTPCLVWDDDDKENKALRYYSHFSGGKHYFYNNGYSSRFDQGTTIWEHFKPIQLL